MRAGNARKETADALHFESLARPIYLRCPGKGFEGQFNGKLCARHVIEAFEADHVARPILHKNDFLARLFADVFRLRRAKPHGESVAGGIMENVQVGHRRVPSLIASVG